MDFLLALLGVVGLSVAVHCLRRIRSLTDRVRDLESQLQTLAHRLRGPAGEPAPPPSPAPRAAQVETPGRPAQQPAPSRAAPPAPPEQPVPLRPTAAPPPQIPPAAREPIPPAAPSPVPGPPPVRAPEPAAPPMSSPVRPPLEPRRPGPPAPPKPVPAPPPPAPPAPLPPIASPPPPPAPSVPPDEPSRTRQEWEALIGGKWLNRIGAVALIIGMGFLLKYGFDNNWFPPVVRVAFGFLIGGGLLWQGARSHRNQLPIFAQGLIGAGISILYISVYATFNFYHLIAQPGAFVLMSLVTVLAFLEALRYDSLAVSLLGWIGGFLTPFLLSTGAVNALGLFTYLALLTAGILAVVYTKASWIVLEPLTLAATYLVYGLWFLRHFAPHHLAVAMVFLSILWGLFHALDVLRLARGARHFPGVRNAVAALNAAACYAAMAAAVHPLHPDWMGSVTAAIGAVYLLTVLPLARRPGATPLEKGRYTLTAVVLVVLATHWEYPGLTAIALWGLEALVLVACGVRWRVRYVWIPSLILFGLALGRLGVQPEAFAYVPIEAFRLLATRRSLTLAVLAAALAASAVVFDRLEGVKGGPIVRALHYAWSALVFLLLTVETNDAFRFHGLGPGGADRAQLAFAHFMTFPAVWMAYSLPLAWLGLRRRLAPLYRAGFAALAVAMAAAVFRGAAFEPVRAFSLALNYRALVLLGMIAGLAAHLLVLRGQREAPRWVDPLRSALHHAWCALALFLCTVETNDYFLRLLGTAPEAARARLSFAHFMTFPGVWLACSLPLAWVGLRARMTPLLRMGWAALVLGVGAAWIQGLAYVPIREFTLAFNLRAGILLALVLGLAVHARWLRAASGASPWAEGLRRLFHHAALALALLLCTVEANDHFRRLLESATGMDQDRLAFTRFMTFPAVWLAYALPLIWMGVRRRPGAPLHLGVLALAASGAAAAIQARGFEPIADFRLGLNYRAGVLLAVITGLAVAARWLSSMPTPPAWARGLGLAFTYATCLLLFQLVTVEANDYFLQKLVGAAGADRLRLSFNRFMTFPALWTAYAVPLVWLGIRRRAAPFCCCGFAALAVGIGLGAAWGLAYQPVELFTFGVNPRAAVLVLLMLALGACVAALKDRAAEYPWGEHLVLVMRVGIAFLALQLLTVEARDYFERLLALAGGPARMPGGGGAAAAAGEIARLRNLQQMSFSLVWLAYSIALIIVGMWRRILALRLVAILVFGVSILKIFVYDLSFLEPLYRIFSFMGLGVILLLVSYLYQRYRGAIFGTA